jgi:uncharacterized iron-regulated membrane protein
MVPAVTAPELSFVRQFIRRPQRLWLRRINFQVHLWAGIFLSLYLILIGLTGSILVFRSELETLIGLKPWHRLDTSGPIADLRAVTANVSRAYPAARIVSIMTPTESDPIFVVSLQSLRMDLKQFGVAAEPHTGTVLGEIPRPDSWLSLVQRLHANLLFGRVGRQTNGVAAAILMLLNITGLVIWWPGLKTWPRAIRVDFRRNWRRINFDLHRAIGFWTLGIVSIWAVSAIYFAWSQEIAGLVDRISPIVSAKPPVVTIPPQRGALESDLSAMIAQAYLLDPQTTLKGVAFPFSRRAPFRLFMRRGKGAGYEYTDTLYFDPYSGKHLATWRYGVNESLGDWIIWSQIPLHFGTYWGLGIKILWAMLGLSIPVLTVTGILMYWNRWLRRVSRRFLLPESSRSGPQYP